MFSYSNGMVIGQPKEQLDTPALIVDLDKMEENIETIAGVCKAAGVAWRPHVKGIKVPIIAHKAIKAGAIGVTCAKLGEAEVMVASGIDDVLVANQIVGEYKITRLVALAGQARVAVLVDDASNIEAISRAAHEVGVIVPVLIEINIGLNRAGVENGEEALALAQIIKNQEGVELAGLASWEGHATEISDPEEKEKAVSQAVGKLVEVAAFLRSYGHLVAIVSCGGSGTYNITVNQPGVTEVQPGGAILGDVRYTTKYNTKHHEAVRILTTVTSRPNSRRIVCDAGKKSMTNDHTAPQPVGLEGGYRLSFSAEHVQIDLDEPNETLRVGDKLEFIAGYTETTINLHDELIGIRNGRVETVWPISARGKVR